MDVLIILSLKMQKNKNLSKIFPEAQYVDHVVLQTLDLHQIAVI